MKVKIDEVSCTGNGRCAKYAPNVYTLDDLGYNADRGKEIAVPEGEEKNAQRGLGACPERAITVTE